jgi:hypothetical protein
MTTSSENDKEPETMPRLIRRCMAQSVNGEPLTSAETIEAGVDAGLLDVVDTTAVFIGTVSPAR